MKFSTNFSLAEFVKSDTAEREGIDNTPGAEIIHNLHRVAYTLEIIRLEFGAPIKVSSGYRCEALNSAVGGSATSKHMQGLAADFRVQGFTPEEAFKRIRKIVGFETLIMEFGRWVHLDLSDNLQNTALIASKINGRTHYKKLLGA